MKKTIDPNLLIIPENNVPLDSKDLPKYLAKIKKPEVNIVFFGTPEFNIPVLEKLNEEFNLIAVVSTPDQILGRKKILTPTPVKEYALKIKVPFIFTPNRLKENKEFVEDLKKLAPDLFVVSAYGKIIPQEVLDIPKFGTLNIHPSLLPKYRGTSPLQTALLSGDKVSGITIMELDNLMDHGPIIYQEKIEISHEDTSESLHTKFFQTGANLLINLIPDYINGLIKPKKQNHNQATFTQIIKKEDGYFEIDNPPPKEKLDQMIRAFYPWPNAWTKWQGKVIKFLPGGLVQMEGKKVISLKEFLNGYKDFPIKTLN
jgi:methionyl-tRNA formyltransferase